MTERTARRSTAIRVSLAAALCLALGAGAFAAGRAVSLRTQEPAVAEAAIAGPDLRGRAVPEVPTAGIPIRTCSIESIASDWRLTNLSASVANTETGEVLYDRSADVPQRTASVLKLLTTAAALEVLGPDARFTTTVVEGDSPGEIVLVGGGDATLATSAGSYYRGAPQLADLANQVRANSSGPITSIVLDGTLWDSSDAWDESWDPIERISGSQAHVTALMVDGSRQDGTRRTVERSADPIRDAGVAFAAALGTPGARLTEGTRSGGEVLASVDSQPVSVLIEQVLMDSDNTTAETLARLVSLELGFDGSAASLADAIPQALEGLDLPGLAELTIRDGSGLSDLNAVAPQLVTDLLLAVERGEGSLELIQAALPVAGVSGDLEDRFRDTNADAVGAVAAKPGWITHERSLAGFITARDGTRLAFTFYAIRDGIGMDGVARTALDELTAAVYRCGNSLSNH